MMRDHELNKLLDHYRVAPPSADLVGRITAQAAAVPQMTAVVAPLRRRPIVAPSWASAAALIAASFLGFWIGFSGILSSPLPEQDLSVYAMGYDVPALDALEGEDF